MITSERPLYGLYRLLWSGLDYIYPPMCGGCGKRGNRWCDDCSKSSQRIITPVCECCGRPLEHAKFCERCKNQPPAYIALRSWAIYSGPIRRAIHQLKYRRDIALGDALALGLIDMLELLDWRIDMVIPVPLGKKRHHERGYNQAAMLALPLAHAKGLPYRPKAIKRVKETASQVHLSREQRVINIENAFLADATVVGGHTILAIDDVTTTGATMHACAQALLDAGATCVYGLTLARAG